MELLARYMQQIETAIKNLPVPVQPVHLYEPYRYMLSLGGKRIRPALTLLSCEACNGNINDAMHAAMAVELFHNFSLVHDDIMDNAPIRRGRPTVHEQWNPNIALLTGDVMLVSAYEQLNKINPEKISFILNLFNKTARQICEGQQMDMDFEDRTDVNMEDYVEMIKLKTAVLLGFAMQAGAVCSDATTGTAENLYQFGINLGIAFQVKDDFLDAYSEGNKFGKQKGGDILANKKTFLYLKFMQKANDGDKREMLNLYTFNRVPNELKVKRVLELFEQYNISADIKKLAGDYFNEAIQSLEKCTLSDEQKKPLHLFAHDLMNRNH